MHVVSGLIELGEYDEVRGYVQPHRRRPDRADQQHHLPRRRPGGGGPAHREVEPGRPSAGRARRRAETTGLPRLDERLATDVNTVLGNLVDNALDASADAPDPIVTVEVVQDDGEVRITVRDTGPGRRPATSASGCSARRLARRTAARRRARHRAGAGPARSAASAAARSRSATTTGAVFVATLPVDPRRCRRDPGPRRRRRLHGGQAALERRRAASRASRSSASRSTGGRRPSRPCGRPGPTSSCSTSTCPT